MLHQEWYTVFCPNISTPPSLTHVKSALAEYSEVQDAFWGLTSTVIESADTPSSHLTLTCLTDLNYS